MWVSILVDTLWENCSTCFLMYLRKASLLHLPMSIIVKIGTLSRYIAMAAPLRMEWVPQSSALKPRTSSPMIVTAARNLSRIVLEETKRSLLLKKKVLTGVSFVVPGYERTRWTREAHVSTGHKGSVVGVLCIVIDSKSSSFFCDSKVTVTVRAECRLGSVWSSFRPLIRNSMLRRQRSFVLRSWFTGTEEYSQDLMAKNQAPTVSWETARLSSFWVFFRSSRRTLGGIAFCWDVCLSCRLYPLNCRRRIGLVCPSSLSLGSNP